MENRKSVAVFFIVMGVLILVLVVVSVARGGKGTDGDTPSESVRTELPDAEVRDVSDSKSEAITAGRVGRKSMIEAYYDSCEVAMGGGGERNEDPMKSIGGGSPSASSSNQSGTATTEDLFGSSQTHTGSDTGSGEKSYRETTAQREARHRRRREEAIDLANEISGKQQGPSYDGETAEPDRIDLSPPENHMTRQSGVISSLSGTGGGVSSLERPSGTYSSDSDHPFRCVFPREEKLKTGQRVSIRLLEDMIIASYVIPKNTHLQAYVTIDSRLELEISSIEIGGHILPLGCVAYDTDGVKGIYCPDAGDVKRTVKTSGLGTIGSIVGGKVGRLAGEIVNTGVSIAQTASGERTVTVPAGYDFFIVKKKQP